MDTKMVHSETASLNHNVELSEGHDHEKLGAEIDYNKSNKSYKIYSEATKRICEDCNQECLNTLLCEHCFRNFLKANFSKWTSGNDDIDSLIRKCQMET